MVIADFRSFKSNKKAKLHFGHKFAQKVAKLTINFQIRQHDKEIFCKQITRDILVNGKSIERGMSCWATYDSAKC